MKVLQFLKRSSWKIRIGLAVLIAFLGLFAFLLFLPLWFGAAVKRLAPDGIVIREVERLSWSRFEMRGISIEQAGIAASVDSVEGYYPFAWLIAGRRGGHELPFVKVGKVSAAIESVANEKPEPQASLSIPELLGEVVNLVDEVDEWILPYALVEEVKIKAVGQTAVLSDLIWKDRKARFSFQLEDSLESLSVLSLVFPEDLEKGAIQVAAENASFETRSELSLYLENASARLAGELYLKDNEATIEAEWSDQDVLPVSAAWVAEEWNLLSNDYGIPIENTRIDFGAKGTWNGKQFESELHGTLSDQSKRLLADEVDFVGGVMGDLESLTLSRLEVEGQGVRIWLNEALGYNYKKNEVLGFGRFDLLADLEKLGLPESKGLLEGDILLAGNDFSKPTGLANFVGKDVEFDGYEVDGVNFRLDFEWPRFEISNALIDFGDGLEASVTGMIDVDARSIEEIEWVANVDQRVAKPFLPEGLLIGGLKMKGTASGLWMNPLHEGLFEIENVVTEDVFPVDFNVQWKGEGININKLSGRAENENASFAWDGAVRSEGAEHSVSFESLELALKTGDVLSLTRPSSLAISLPEGDQVEFELTTDFELADGESLISLVSDVEYPTAATAKIQLREFLSEKWIQPWVKIELLKAEISHAVIDYVLVESDEVSLTASYDAAVLWKDNEYSFIGKAKSDRERIELEGVSVEMDGVEVLVANGDFPIPFDFAKFTNIPIDTNQKFAFSMRTENSPLLSATLSEWSEYEFSNVGFALDLRGPFTNPEGSFNLIANVKVGEGEENGGIVELVMNAKVLGEVIALEELNALLGSEKFAASGRVEIPDGAYERLFAGEYEQVDWQQISYEMELPKSELSPIARFAPQFIAPGGRIEAKISGKGSDGLAGFVNIEELNTRALFPFGALRDIETQLEFKGQRIELGRFSGMVGRESIRMQGYADANDKNWHVSIKSDDTPLLRQAGMLLRSTMDLSIDGNMEDGTDISGTILLNEGMFAMDTSVLASGGGASGRSAEARPPYFSVDVPPLNDWRLNVELKGEEFMRVETPAATGVLSMDMKLLGTLGEPFLRGGTLFEEGFVVFPFASFEVDQGEVNFPINDPYTPLIQMHGRSRRFGYDLGVEITGEAFDPQIRFTSSPALTNEQILLMVMAGENPEGVVKYSASQRASKIGSYLSKGLLSSGGDGGFGSRLSLSSGENLSEQGKETLQVEVLVTDRVQLLGEYDEYDAWNAGVRFKVLGANFEKLERKKREREEQRRAKKEEAQNDE